MSLTGAYGGEKWSPRLMARREEMREIWGDWGSGSECTRLRAVLLHRPGAELDEIVDFDAEGLRTNHAGAEQVTWALTSIGVTVEPVMLPYGAMHLDGILNFAAPDLAVVWPRRTPMNIVRALRERGVRVVHLLDEPATH